MQSDQQEQERKPIDPKPAQDVQSQEELERLYIEQQKRMSCPGCGEEDQRF